MKKFKHKKAIREIEEFKFNVVNLECSYFNSALDIAIQIINNNIIESEEINNDYIQNCYEAYHDMIKKYMNLSDKYHDLLLAVESKYPGETRHDTAHRYISEREKNKDMGAKKDK
jgi:hypothetical protein